MNVYKEIILKIDWKKNICSWRQHFNMIYTSISSLSVWFCETVSFDSRISVIFTP